MENFLFKIIINKLKIDNLADNCDLNIFIKFLDFPTFSIHIDEIVFDNKSYLNIGKGKASEFCYNINELITQLSVNKLLIDICQNSTINDNNSYIKIGGLAIDLLIFKDNINNNNDDLITKTFDIFDNSHIIIGTIDISIAINKIITENENSSELLNTITNNQISSIKSEPNNVIADNKISNSCIKNDSANLTTNKHLFELENPPIMYYKNTNIVKKVQFEQVTNNKNIAINNNINNNIENNNAKITNNEILECLFRELISLKKDFNNTQPTVTQKPKIITVTTQNNLNKYSVNNSIKNKSIKFNNLANNSSIVSNNISFSKNGPFNNINYIEESIKEELSVNNNNLETINNSAVKQVKCFMCGININVNNATKHVKECKKNRKQIPSNNNSRMKGSISGDIIIESIPEEKGNIFNSDFESKTYYDQSLSATKKRTEFEDDFESFYETTYK